MESRSQTQVSGENQDCKNNQEFKDDLKLKLRFFIRNTIEGDEASLKECIELVKTNPYNFIFIKDQTHDLCMEAVKQNDQLLYFVDNQTPDICLEAVRKNGLSIQHIKQKFLTDEICLTAVQQNGLALEHIPDEFVNKKIIIEAMKQNGLALQYVEHQTNDIIVEAFNNNIHSLHHVTAFDNKLYMALCIAFFKHKNTLKYSKLFFILLIDFCLKKTLDFLEMLPF